MGKLYRITETQKLLVKILKEEEITDDTVIFTPDEYLRLMKLTSYNGNAIKAIKKYRNKKIVVNGNLDLANTPTQNMGNITINGRLDLSSTNISSIDGIEASYIWTRGTPYERKQERLRIQRIKNNQQRLRDADEWNRETGLTDMEKCANALFDFLISTEYEEKQPEDEQKLEELYAEKERREEIEKETEDNENLLDLEAIEEEIKEIENRIDVYNLNYEGRHLNLYSFKLIIGDNESSETWAVGDEYDTEKTANRLVEDLISDVGINGFNKGFIENHIDDEALKDYFRESEEEYIRDNVEDFFDEDDFEYSDPKVQERIDEIEELLEDSENLSQEEYDELNEELEDLKDSDKIIPEHMIEDQVERNLSDKVYDSYNVIKEYGLDIDDFIDMESFIKDVVDSDGYGHTINGYDGTEDTVEFDGETYYIFQIDG